MSENTAFTIAVVVSVVVSVFLLSFLAKSRLLNRFGDFSHVRLDSCLGRLFMILVTFLICFGIVFAIALAICSGQFGTLVKGVLNFFISDFLG